MGHGYYPAVVDKIHVAGNLPASAEQAAEELVQTEVPIYFAGFTSSRRPHSQDESSKSIAPAESAFSPRPEKTALTSDVPGTTSMRAPNPLPKKRNISANASSTRPR